MFYLLSCFEIDGGLTIFLKFLALVIIQLGVYAQNTYRINRQIVSDLLKKKTLILFDLLAFTVKTFVSCAFLKR